jgi:adenylosuccinate lyase
MLAGSHMSISSAEIFLRNAREQVSQRDINESLLKAIGELTSEVKRLDDEIRRARRDIQFGRRF